VGIFSEVQGQLKEVQDECQQARQEAAEETAKKAAEILTHVKGRAREAARQGRDWVEVQDAYTEYVQPWWSFLGFFGGTYSGWLQGVSKLVYEQCVEAGLRPFLRWDQSYSTESRAYHWSVRICIKV
jgi:hypothetical protein